ncbi:MAG: alpha-2-macroglobulin [Thermoanaerobaculia bacterium]
MAGTKTASHLPAASSGSLLALALCLALALGISQACAPPLAGNGPGDDSTTGSNGDDPPVSDGGDGLGAEGPCDPEASWAEVASLIDQQRFQAASEIVREIFEGAKSRRDVENWTRGLIELVQLETGLHGYETAVRLLRSEDWPDDPVSVAALELYYAQGLVHYLQVYSWEIRQRERVASEEEVDLKAWTAEEIFDEADRAYARVWERRQELGALDLETLSRYLTPNNYPDGLRDSLRDAVTYLWVELLANTSFWTPRESAETYRLDLSALLEPAERLESVEPDAHPLLRLTALLGDLESWHAAEGRPEAAFEARLERLRRLHASISQTADRKMIRGNLETHLQKLGDKRVWWSVGMSLLAEFLRSDPDPWALVGARQVAEEGERRHPGSLGAARCRHLIAQIEAPSFSVTTMATDGPARRSIEIRHKNLERLYFRAYEADLFEIIENSKDYRLLPGYREFEKLFRGRNPVAEWKVDLPETPDLREHRSFAVPDLERSGFHLIVVSARPSFSESGNELKGLYFNLSDLVLVSRPMDGNLEVAAVSGETGEAISGAEIHLYRYDYRRRGHRRVDTKRADSEGRVLFDREGDGNNYFLVARSGSDVALDETRRYFSSPSPDPTVESSLLYTDRSIYRPGQDVLWKVIGYSGKRSGGEFQVVADRKLTIELFDANNESVAKAEVRTNEHGSASGSFEIPGGRLLGNWSLRSSSGGRTVLKVEEYKRPTFEATLEPPTDSLRLNRRAELTGTARYYFGLPVVDGEVKWRVTREPVYPYWWWWYYPPAPAAAETIASGISDLTEDGVFSIEFLPEADEREAERGVTYRFRVAADVLDSGGETSKAERVFRLGFVAVEAAIDRDRRFVLAGSAVTLTVRRQDLDGTARAGKGSWRLVRLAQPGTVPLPADVELPDPPAVAAESEPAYRTAGDRLRPRWQGVVNAEMILRGWRDGEEVETGALVHGDDGEAELELGSLRPGAYRFHYATRDAFGAEYKSATDFLVAKNSLGRLALPAVLEAETSAAAVGETARFLIHSGLESQRLIFELFRRGRRIRREVLSSDGGPQVLEIPISEADRGGLGARLTLVRDHQLMTINETIFVPWDDKRLEVKFSSFRDYLKPGGRETWRVQVRGVERDLVTGSAELLAYMYDRSLDVFAPHQPPDPAGLYPRWGAPMPSASNLGPSGAVWHAGDMVSLPGYPPLYGDRLNYLSSYGIGGLGYRVGGRMRPMRRGMVMESRADMPASAALDDVEASNEEALKAELKEAEAPAAGESPVAEAELRSDFSETAFWEPHLLLEDDGSVAFEFEVPDSVTEWNVWVHAITRDLRAGRVTEQVKTVKDLLVRPYLPRFLREGDKAKLRVVVQNAGDEPLAGALDFDIVDAETQEDLAAAFGVDASVARAVAFSVEPGKSWTHTVPVATPARIGQVAFKVRGEAGEFSDGELRTLPVLPGRMHLAQSRFVTLKDADRKALSFDDLARDDDPTRIDQQLVVTLDTQLFYSVLSALPYLVNYPYECTEQTLNRFLSTGIVSTLYEDYPAVKRMAREFSDRETQYENWQADDPNRKMALEETPWVGVSRGGRRSAENLINVLDPKIAKAQRKSALAKLKKAQTAVGGFPWFPGGPPSPYMTLYLLNGFSRALEFGVEVPKPMVRQAWSYMHRHYIDELVEHMMGRDCCWEFITFLNYVLSSYPDEAWTGGVFTRAERERMLDFSFRHWKDHSPMSKAHLALTLERDDRTEDARLVFDSVMDSSKTTEELGTYWAPEDRAWLWYNDTIETHAFALRTLTELDEDDSRREGLVQWLLLNKKLSHWKSTRATAEVIYSLVHYLEHEGTLAAREEVTIAIGEREPHTFVFEPDEYTGNNNQVRIDGEDIEPATDSTVVVEKETLGFAFASATWHFSTEELPAEARGDFFEAHRTYYRRVHSGDGWRLEPLSEGAKVEVGDQVEVHVSIRAKHAAEYVHLRDPRPAGFEPERSTSGYQWDLGLVRYEEVRDSGMNFFFERLPVGEYTMKHRLRAATAGTFQSAPVTLQSMYAPEFTAYSAGEKLTIVE